MAGEDFAVPVMPQHADLADISMRSLELPLARDRAILAAALAFEMALFAAIAQNFLTRENLFELVRLSVELGLLAIALTPVIVTGGIDLSVGSVMGLAAVAFGAAYRDWNMSVPVAMAAALCVGLVGGS